MLDNHTYYLSELEIDGKYISHIATLTKIEKTNPIDCKFIAPYVLCNAHDTELLYENLELVI